MTSVPASLSDLDRGVLRCLQLAPRAPFRLVAEVLGVSEQTVARRYRVLRDSGVIRVTGVLRIEALGQTNWMVRIRCKPSGAEALALALARRPDIGWVYVYSGAVGVLCTVRARTTEAREDLLIDRLPRSTAVLDISAAMTLHTFVAERPEDWIDHRLTAAQQQRIAASASEEEKEGFLPTEQPWLEGGDPVELDPVDWQILDGLAEDGRASYVVLAERAGVTSGQARRRLLRLFAQGVVYLDVDIRPSPSRAMGAHLWMTAPPSALRACGAKMAELPHASYVAAITGHQNLVAAVTCASAAELYRLVSDGVGAIPGITGVEVAPQARIVKQTGPVSAVRAD